MKRLILRGVTNSGDKVKQYCFLLENKKKGFERSVVIHRLILVKDMTPYLLTGHIFIRQFKDKYVVSNKFSMKLSTMQVILKWARNTNIKDK